MVCGGKKKGLQGETDLFGTSWDPTEDFVAVDFVEALRLVEGLVVVPYENPGRWSSYVDCNGRKVEVLLRFERGVPLPCVLGLS